MFTHRMLSSNVNIKNVYTIHDCMQFEINQIKSITIITNRFLESDLKSFEFHELRFIRCSISSIIQSI